MEDRVPFRLRKASDKISNAPNIAKGTAQTIDGKDSSEHRQIAHPRPRVASVTKAAFGSEALMSDRNAAADRKKSAGGIGRLFRKQEGDDLGNFGGRTGASLGYACNAEGLLFCDGYAVKLR